MISASPTGPATLSSVPWPERPMLTRAGYTAHTVPNRPTNGAVEPTEASTVSPDSRRAVSSSITRRMARVRNSASPLLRAASACQARCANGSSGWRSSSCDSTAAIDGAFQNPSRKPVLRRRSKSTVSDLVTIRYQLRSDITSSTARIALATESVCARNWVKPTVWAGSTCSAFQFERDRYEDPGGDGFGAALGGDELPPFHRFARHVVEARVAAGRGNLDFVGPAAGIDQDPQHHPALLAQAA